MISPDRRFTGAQRLVKLYERLLSGTPVSPSEYARETGVKRQTVYYQLEMLSQCGIPVVNSGYGQWTLLDFEEKVAKYDGLQ